MEDRKLAAIALLCSNCHLIPGNYLLGHTTRITSSTSTGVFYFTSSEPRHTEFVYANVSLPPTATYFELSGSGNNTLHALRDKPKCMVLIPNEEANRIFLDEIVAEIRIQNIHDRLCWSDTKVWYGSDFCIEKYMDIEDILVESPDEFSNRFLTEEELEDYCHDYYADLDPDGDGGCDADMFMYEEGMYCGY